jgi:hypothetical protein
MGAAGTRLAVTEVVPPQYQLALPQLVVEGQRLATHRGTGVSVMLALTYIRCWGPDAVVAIYPPEYVRGTPRIDDAIAAATTAARRSSQLLLVSLPFDDRDLAPAVVCARVSVLWSLARVAQPALMELLDAVTPLIELDAEAPALARLYDRVSSIDFARDLVQGSPGTFAPMAVARADCRL